MPSDIAEVRALIHECRMDSRHRARIIRTSGEQRFLQVKVDREGKLVRELTESGEITIEAAKAAIDVYFVFPKAVPCQARESYALFRELADPELSDAQKTHIVLQELDPSQKSADGRMWAGEFLSHTHRYISHISYPSEAAHANANLRVKLYLSRAPKYGPCAYQTGRDETENFKRWIWNCRASS